MVGLKLIFDGKLDATLIRRYAWIGTIKLAKP